MVILVNHFLTWVVCNKSNSCPSSHGYSDGVPQWRINKVELGGISGRVEIAGSSSKNVEAVAMNMHGVLLSKQNVGPLEHHLHS